MKNNLERILFIPDCHVPYHDKKAFELLHKVSKAFKPDQIVIQGDFMDFYDVSFHLKDPSRRFKLKEEIEAGIVELNKIKQLGAKNIVFIAGNHENRLERYLQDKAPELYNIISIPKILQLDKLGFKYVPYKETYSLGKIEITHDVGVAGRFAVHKALDSYQTNILTGHTHRMAYIVEGNSQGVRHLSASFGWLGDVESVDYMHKVKIKRDWTLGFGIGYLDKKTQNVYVTPVPIINYSCLIEGVLYSV